jgi:receptor expression-enhancing protein 5/6
MAGQLNYYKEQAVKLLYEKNKLTDLLAQAELKTQIKREYLAAGILGVLALYLIFGYGAELICNLIAFVYPAYRSIKALETKLKEDDTRWLTYWVVFAVFSIVEFFSDILLSWMPFYWLAKCMFLVWCYVPTSYNGSDMIYQRIIRPVFLKHQTEIDATMGKVTDKINRLAEDASKAATDALKNE